MTTPTKLFSDAAAEVSWLASQHNGLWINSPSRRLMVERVCASSRWVGRTVSITLYDAELLTPTPFWLSAASDALTWCNTAVIGEPGGVRARKAIQAMVMLGRDPRELTSAYELILDMSSDLRTSIGRNSDMLTEDEKHLVTENLSLARWAANKWGRGTEDAYQDAVLGLSASVRHFDPSRGSFASFARQRMRGEILNGLKRRDHHTSTGREVAADTDDMLDAAEWGTLSGEIEAARDRVCGQDDLNRRVFDAVAALDGSRSLTAALRDLSSETGVSVEALVKRWYTLREKLVVVLGHLRAS